MKTLIGQKPLADQGSIYIGTEGVLYAPYIDTPELLPAEKFKAAKLPSPGGNDHYLQFVEACRGNGKTSAPFDYSGPLTESVLLGCLRPRVPQQDARMGPGEPRNSQTSGRPTPWSVARTARAGRSLASHEPPRYGNCGLV